MYFSNVSGILPPLLLSLLVDTVIAPAGTTTPNIQCRVILGRWWRRHQWPPFPACNATGWARSGKGEKSDVVLCLVTSGYGWPDDEGRTTRFRFEFVELEIYNFPILSMVYISSCPVLWTHWVSGRVSDCQWVSSECVSDWGSEWVII